MEKKETKLVEALRKDYKQLYVKEYTTRWREERFIRTIELGIMSLKNSEEYISQELDKAREEGFNDGVEKTVGIIQKELDELLLQKDGENYWVGDILRVCGYTVEKILPKNMKGYLVKLKTKEDEKN
jgi:hypothetical protein